MKNLSIVALGLFVLAFSLTGYTHASYAEMSIAVVDVEKVLNEADASKALNKKRSKAREAFLSKLSKEEKVLRDEGQALFEKRKDLSDEDFAKQQRTYQEKVAKMSKLTQQNRRAFESASNVSLEALKDELALAVQEIANDKKIALVISNRNVIAGATSLDITDETIAAMNKKKIKIPFNVKK